MSNLGVASILTEYVRVHDAWSEFLNKVSDRMMEDCTHEMSLLVLPSR